MNAFDPPRPDDAQPATPRLAIVDQHRLDANWRAITIELDAPRPSRTERLMRAVGVPSQITRLVVATPSLRRAWYLALAAAMLVGLVSPDPALPRQSLLPLLVLAPLVPLLGVAMAYGPSSDPAYEMQVATPTSGLRLLALRAAAVLGLSTVIIVPLAMFNSVARSMALAWILPAFAIAATSIGLMTWTSPRRAAAIAAGAWMIVVVVSQVGDDPLVVFTLFGQIVALLVFMAAIAATVVRRTRFDELIDVR